MLLLATRTASPACLRCQLRQVIFGRQRYPLPSLSHQRCHDFSTTPPFLQDATARRRRDDERPYVYRHVHLEGRIIGKEGRRQREHSERLPTSSLGKPSEVIVLRDVIEDPGPDTRSQVVPSHTGGNNNTVLSADEIQAAISEQHLAPNQDEVDASLEAIRPQHTVVDTAEYQRLARTLIEGYNVRQLSGYLVQPLGRTATSAGTALTQHGEHTKLQATRWRPGRTAIEQRVDTSDQRKGEGGTTKTKLADQILRSVWNVTIQSEEQQLGELEVPLKSWQMAMFFDRSKDGRPGYADFIESKFLIRASEVTPHRADKVMRITARRQDAEEIVSQMESKLEQVGRLDLDLVVFKPLLGQGNWPRTLGKLFSNDDIEQVSKLTGSVVQVETPNRISIYDLSLSKRENARRLLLSLLDLPSPKTTERLDTTDLRQALNKHKVLKTVRGLGDLRFSEFPTLNAHQRHRNLDLFRLVNQKANDELTDNKWRQTAHRLARKLEQLQPADVSAMRNELDERSPWSFVESADPSPWAARLCVLLQTKAHASFRSGPREKKIETQFIQLDQVPGLANLLSMFQPLESSRASPLDAFGYADERPASAGDVQLIAHLTPSPYAEGGVEALRGLPRIVMQFGSSRTSHSNSPDSRPFRIDRIDAVLNTQQINVPFPDHVTDISFERTTVIRGSQELLDDGQVMAFEQELRRSIAAGDDVLAGMPELTLRLPKLAVTSGETRTDFRLPSGPGAGEPADTPVLYFLERFEEVQTVDLVPRRHADGTLYDPALLAALRGQDWPASLFLRYRDVDAGAFGGRGTQVCLMSRQGPEVAPPLAEPVAESSPPDPDHEGAGTGAGGKPAVDGPTVQFAKTAMGLVKVLTSADAGEVESLVPWTTNLRTYNKT